MKILNYSGIYNINIILAKEGAKSNNGACSKSRFFFFLKLYIIVNLYKQKIVLDMLLLRIFCLYISPHSYYEFSA